MTEPSPENRERAELLLAKVLLDECVRSQLSSVVWCPRVIHLVAEALEAAEQAGIEQGRELAIDRR